MTRRHPTDMSIRLLCALLLPFAGSAAVWPDNFGAFQRVAAKPAAVSNQKIWDELGLQNAETARYEAGKKQFSATAYRLQDTTAAFAAFEWQRPADAKPSPLAKVAAGTPDSLLLVHGNYLLSIQGYQPPAAELSAVVGQLPLVEQAPLPTLPDYLPSENLVPNSERYALGPAGLAAFDPGIPPSVAGFHFGAEAQIANYRGPGGEMRLAIFSYPTPQMAIQQYEAFGKLAGAMAKRSGPLIAVTLAPPNPDAAEHLLSLVRYQGAITLSERIPTRKDNIGDLVINAFELIGILLVFSTVSGLAFGGFRALFRRGSRGQEGDPMILLHLEDR